MRDASGRVGITRGAVTTALGNRGATSRAAIIDGREEQQWRRIGRSWGRCGAVARLEIRRGAGQSLGTLGVDRGVDSKMRWGAGSNLMPYRYGLPRESHIPPQQRAGRGWQHLAVGGCRRLRRMSMSLTVCFRISPHPAQRSVVVRSMSVVPHFGHGARNPPWLLRLPASEGGASEMRWRMSATGARRRTCRQSYPPVITPVLGLRLSGTGRMSTAIRPSRMPASPAFGLMPTFPRCRSAALALMPARSASFG